ncbi:septation ring formation regulator EzrA [uncultured Brachyspira sp.]|uniref:septation ring formation regulator EzrA n=1 Tax=uncultured Brachyspira sp. TaxID=221953 RepID=UPI0025ED5DC9|nr:septation ring formation regulator EzrA [uncultured Brachyspira sp.]
MKSKKVIDNNREVKKEKKTYSLGAVFLVVIIFVIISIALTFIRNMKSNEILKEVHNLDRQIEILEKEVKVLTAKESELSSPNRFIETAIINGFSSAGTEDDIIYLKIESDK